MGDFWEPAGVADEDDQNEEESGTTIIGGRDGVIFLLDADENLTGDSECFRKCLECIEAGMLNRIISNSRDMVGIVLYNTEHSPDPPSILSATKDISDSGIVVPQNTAIIVPMIEIAKEPIGYVKNLKDSEDFFDFKNRYGSLNVTTAKSSFSDALWLCSRMLVRCGYKLQSSTIVLFTRIEEPHPNGSHEFQQSFVRAKDFYGLGVLFLLVPMSDNFDVNKFYKEFIATIYDIEPEQFEILSGKEQCENLLNRKFQRDARRACQRYLNLTIAKDLEISCGVYSLTRTSKIPTSIKLLRDTNERVIAKRLYMAGEFNEDTMKMEFTHRLMPGEIRKYQEIGGKKIRFTPDEIATMRSLQSPGLRLLGFKPLAQLPLNYFIKSCKLLYPYEKNMTGATLLFRALWERCLEKKKFAMCVLTLRRKAPPRYVALIPQQEEIHGNDGFCMIFLPMQNDIRSLDEILMGEQPEIPPEGIELFQKMAKRIKFVYKPEIFKNPHVDLFYKNMEALVFEEEISEYADMTLPNTDYQDSKLEPFIDDLERLFGTDCNVTEKRKAPGSSSVSSAAKVQKTNDTTNVKSDDIISAIKSGAISKITVGVLKDHLQQLGITFTSKSTKSVLIDLITKHYNI